MYTYELIFNVPRNDTFETFVKCRLEVSKTSKFKYCLDF